MRPDVPAHGSDRLLTVEQAAERLNTKPRFVRRLVAERRIAFVKVGRYVRISSRDLEMFIENCRVERVQSGSGCSPGAQPN